MPLSEKSFETTDDAMKVHEAILDILARKDYKIQQDTRTTIVAKHGFSAKDFAHTVEIDLFPPSEAGKTTVTIRMDHRGSETYLERLVDELITTLPTIQRKARPLSSPLNPEVNRAILWQKDENLVYYMEDVISGQKGVLIVTNQRMLFATKPRFVKEYGITYGINLEQLTSVSVGQRVVGILDKLAILEQSGRRVEFIKQDINSLIPVINEAISERKNYLSYPSIPPVSAEPPKQFSSSIDDIKKLAELKDMGIITEEEFQAKKKQLLGI